MFKKVEKIAVFFAIIAAVLMSLGLSLGVVLLNLSFGALAIIYMYSGVALKKSTPKFLKKMALDEKGNSQLVPNLIIGYTWSVGVIGVLITIQGYPQSEIMINFGLVGILFGLGYSYFQYRNKVMEKLEPFFVRMILIFSIVGMFSILPKEGIQDFFHTKTIQTIPLEIGSE